MAAKDPVILGECVIAAYLSSPMMAHDHERIYKENFTVKDKFLWHVFTFSPATFFALTPFMILTASITSFTPEGGAEGLEPVTKATTKPTSQSKLNSKSCNTLRVSASLNNITNCDHIRKPLSTAVLFVGAVPYTCCTKKTMC